MKLYAILSDEYEYVEPVLDYGEGPTFHTRDALFVIAENRNKANYYYQKKHHRKTLYDVRDWQKCKIKLAQEIDLPAGEMTLDQAYEL